MALSSTVKGLLLVVRDAVFVLVVCEPDDTSTRLREILSKRFESVSENSSHSRVSAEKEKEKSALWVPESQTV